jgi:hypothetical protein
MAEVAVLPATVVGDDGEAAAEQRDFGLPGELMAVLPSDPYAQLDVARRITSIALSSRLGGLEAEAARLRAQLAQRDAEAEDLRERVEQLDASLAVATGRLRRVEEEKVRNSLTGLPFHRTVQRLSLTGGSASATRLAAVSCALPRNLDKAQVTCVRSDASVCFGRGRRMYRRRWCARTRHCPTLSRS